MPPTTRGENTTASSSVRRPRGTVRSLPRQLRNYIVLTATIGLLFTVFNGVMLFSDPNRDAGRFGIVVFLFACLVRARGVRFRRGDKYVEHRFWEYPIIVGLALAPAYSVALAMSVVYLVVSTVTFIFRREQRTIIPFDFGAVSICVTFGCYIGSVYPPFSYGIGALVFVLLREAFTYGHDLLSSGSDYANRALRSKWAVRLLVPLALAMAATTMTAFIGPQREFMIALPVSLLLFYWLLQSNADTREEQDSWRHMERISAKFIGEVDEHKAIAVALDESLELFSARRSTIVLPGIFPEPGSKWTLEAGPSQGVDVDFIPPDGDEAKRPEAETRYSQVIDLSLGERTLGYMVIEWDDNTPEKRTRTTLNKTFGHAVAASIANTRHAKNISTQAAEKAREAERDPLTSLGNRSMLRERGPALLAESEDIDRACALLLFDLDGFKRINDTLGHAAGDQVLVEVSRRIHGTVRKNDLAIRLGGDEFAVLAVDMEQAADAERLAAKITQALIPPIEVEGLQISVESSIGVALFPSDADDIESLLKLADIAMYQAKAVGRGKTFRYTPAINTHSTESLSLATDLRRAIYADGELVLHYQPQVSLATNRVVGVEALIRWNHPTLGMLSPDRFVHIAERSNLVRAFTLMIIEQALSDRVLMRSCMPDATVSVNLSAQNLLDTGLAIDVARLLAKYQVDASELVLEVTETTTAKDVIAADKVLNDLSELGCLIAMDDFGSGYATMESLRSESPIGEIKIDKGFIENISARERDCRVARAIMEIAHAWGCRVVAEGIEDQATFNLLREMNCDIAQGYLLHKPAALPVIMEWVRKWSAAHDIEACQPVTTPHLT